MPLPLGERLRGGISEIAAHVYFRKGLHVRAAIPYEIT